jgi:hypothetical protein
MDNAEQIAHSLLQGQVGGPFAAVGAYPYVGDAINVVPQYPGRPAAGSPSVNPYYVGAPAVDSGAQGQSVQYGPQTYVAGDVTYLGFGATSIPPTAAGGQGTSVPVSTNRPFTPQKMGCPSTVLGLLITQINISGTNLLANSLGVPVELLSEVSTFPQVLWPTLDTATGVEFVVANPTLGALVFSGAFYGTQVRR